MKLISEINSEDALKEVEGGTSPIYIVRGSPYSLYNIHRSLISKGAETLPKKSIIKNYMGRAYKPVFWIDSGRIPEMMKSDTFVVSDFFGKEKLDGMRMKEIVSGDFFLSISIKDLLFVNDLSCRERKLVILLSDTKFPMSESILNYQNEKALLSRITEIHLHKSECSEEDCYNENIIYL
jgi:hypothetical protein